MILLTRTVDLIFANYQKYFTGFGIFFNLNLEKIIVLYMYEVKDACMV